MGREMPIERRRSARLRLAAAAVRAPGQGKIRTSYLSREAAAAVALARSSASSHCSVVCSSTVDPRRRWKTVITRRQRLRARMGDRLQEKQDRHRWTNQETNHFLEVAMDLAENGEFKKGKYRRSGFRKIHAKMAEKGSRNVSYANVKSKFYTYMDIWNRYNNLKCEAGSCFNPETGTFDAPKEWWASLHQNKKEKYMMFRKCIPYMEKLDIIFSHMEDPPKEIIWKFVNNGPSSRSTTGHWGYEQTESPTVHQGSASLEAQIDKLLDELLESGVQELDDDYINAVDLLRDPIILKRYSKLSSMEKKIGFMRKLRAQGVQVANRSHGHQ